MSLKARLAPYTDRVIIAARPAVKAARERIPVGPRWTSYADGLATVHHSPFLADPVFAPAYAAMAKNWFTQEEVDVRWRMWILTRLALQAKVLEGDFAEFGTYRGGCALMLLTCADLGRDRRLFLFDTYEGIPASNLTERERAEDFAGRLADTSADYVRTLLGAWDPIPQIVAGDVFETMPATDTGPLAFVHLDLNASAPTRHALEHAHERLVPGGVVLFDDYGWHGYEDQRASVDAFLAGRPETIVALPTGQAFYVKAP